MFYEKWFRFINSERICPIDVKRSFWRNVLKGKIVFLETVFSGNTVCCNILFVAPPLLIRQRLIGFFLNNIMWGWNKINVHKTNYRQTYRILIKITLQQQRNWTNKQTTSVLVVESVLLTSLAPCKACKKNHEALYYFKVMCQSGHISKKSTFCHKYVDL